MHAAPQSIARAHFTPAPPKNRARSAAREKTHRSVQEPRQNEGFMTMIRKPTK